MARVVSEESREELRARLLADAPRTYSPWLHLAATTGSGVAALAVAAWRIHGLHAAQLVAVPAAVLLANVLEWRAHRHLLHRRVKGLSLLYERHTPMHHRLYGYDTMAIREPAEMRLVLLPAAFVAGLVLVAAPVAALAGAVFGANVQWLVVATSGAYALAYELLHLSCHLPDAWLVSRLPLVRFVREHHRRHHHPPLMKSWNFNVTIPLMDALRGTIAPRALIEAELGREPTRVDVS